MFENSYFFYFVDFLRDTVFFNINQVLSEVEYSVRLPIDIYFNFIENDIILFFTNVEYDEYIFYLDMYYDEQMTIFEDCVYADFFFILYDNCHENTLNINIYS